MSISSSFWNWEPDVFGKCPTVPGEVLAPTGCGWTFAADERARFAGMIPGKLPGPKCLDKRHDLFLLTGVDQRQGQLRVTSSSITGGTAESSSSTSINVTISPL